MRVQESAQLVAIDVFEQAEQTGQRVTLAMVEQRVAEFLAHLTGPRELVHESRSLVRALS